MSNDNLLERQPLPKRRKKPSATKDYHKKTPNLPERLRVPNDVANNFLALREFLKCDNGDVIRWLLQKCAQQIENMISLDNRPSLELPSNPSTSMPSTILITEPTNHLHTLLNNDDGEPSSQPSIDYGDNFGASLSDLDDDSDVMAAINDDTDHGGNLEDSLSNLDNNFDVMAVIDNGDYKGESNGAFDDEESSQEPIDINDSQEPIDINDSQEPIDINDSQEPIDIDDDNDAGENIMPNDGSSNGNEREANRSGAIYGFLAKKKLDEFFCIFRVTCPLDNCDALCNHNIREWGQCFTIALTCSHGHCTSWQTGETQLIRATPQVTSRLFCATLCAGLSCTQMQEICRTIGLREPSESSFYRFQRGADQRIGWCTAVMDTWEEQQHALHMELLEMQEAQRISNEGVAEEAARRAQEAIEIAKEAAQQVEQARLQTEMEEDLVARVAAEQAQVQALEGAEEAEKVAQLAIFAANKAAHTSIGIVVMVDARFDSSRSGFHGTAPILEHKSGYCIEMVTHTRIEDNGSWNIEDRVVKEGLDNLHEKGLSVIEVIHDDKSSVDAILKRMTILSQKDLWHKAKKLMQKFKEKMEDAKEKVTDFVGTETTELELRKKTNKALSKFLKEKNRPSSGNKEQLVQRCMNVLGIQASLSNDEINRTRRGGRDSLLYPVFSEKDMAYKFKSWFYVCCNEAAKRRDKGGGLLCCELANVEEHWSGNHEFCELLNPSKKCVIEKHGSGQAYFSPNSPEYHELTKWLQKHITRTKMAHYTRARENFLSETFHSLINKYASKRIHWRASHLARLACAALDWNENRSRECLAIRTRTTTDTAVRRRPKRYRVLSTKTENWKEKVATRIFGATSS